MNIFPDAPALIHTGCPPKAYYLWRTAGRTFSGHIRNKGKN
ncbi:hypothetical protein HMPREF9445_01467 [Bacteroides clarus YIT 12056]|uniref:Uncharacterized protein n=1 Tax=Bacteroides clarus YIT 12056 TaxID=762984 RepID=A0ABN0CQ59_9BACE|nr:hypothetical protein HMPREF9445_01467 [Bacteroides clarus YIT 12056]